ncbi:MAG TPA: hypothetical protein VKB95_12460 [Chitinophagaceae bacterium]|nr:hypothetical protein [Chitinophagaceae bacterium]
MKKYLLGLTAFVLAIGFTAFSTAKAKNSKPFANYYWYPVNSAGETTDVTFDATSRDKTYAMAHFTSCGDVPTKPYCILGSSSSSLSIGTQISSPPGDATVLKTQ